MRELALCEQLFNASHEDEVADVLRKAGYWDDPRAWRDFGGKENNFSTIGNQQASAEAALVEKLINSIDAVLTLQCRLAGTDPEGPDAPASVRDAVARYFGIRDGNLAELTGTELTTHAGRIGLVATGTRQSPNLTVFDSGEGQSPDDFPATFLSIVESNKLKIPFVQGKFNMGGTGVLQFCGERNLEVILSRRHPALSPSDPSWGFTVVRRDNPSGNVKSSVYRYLAPNGNVLRFPFVTPLTLKLDAQRAGTSPLPQLEWGTAIKLYQYQLPGGAKTNIVFDLFNDISCLMPGVAFPIRFYERRDYEGHTLESTMIGLEARLERDTSDNLEFAPTTHVLLPDGLRLRARVYAFKRRDDGGSSAEKFRGREGVLFVVNGQAHGFLDKQFFKRQKVGLPWVADDLLVLVEATTLSGRVREDLFMNSRDRLRDGSIKREIEAELERCLHDHDLLRELNDRRRSAALGKKLEEDKALEDILKDIVLKSPVLNALLNTGSKIPDPEHTASGSNSRLAFSGKRFPTFFKPMKGTEKRSAHLGQRFKMQFETDAENRFFSRQIEPGDIALWVEGAELDIDPPNLMNGIATLNVALPAGVTAGTILHYEGQVTSPDRADPFEFEFERAVVIQVQPPTNGSGKRKPPSEPSASGERQLPASSALPPITSVRKPEWSTYDFDAESALLVRGDPGSGHDFFVNLDNKFLHMEIRSRAGHRTALEAQFKYGLALFGLACLRHLQAENYANGEDVDPEIFIGKLSRAFAPFLLPMVDGLSELMETPPSPDAEEDS